jgi:hypothetical protein
MSDLYPEIEPSESGMLGVGAGNSIYWEVCGNPEGKPAAVLHGGPGSGCAAMFRHFFDPKALQPSGGPHASAAAPVLFGTGTGDAEAQEHQARGRSTM